MWEEVGHWHIPEMETEAVLDSGDETGRIGYRRHHGSRRHVVVPSKSPGQPDLGDHAQGDEDEGHDRTENGKSDFVMSERDWVDKIGADAGRRLHGGHDGHDDGQMKGAWKGKTKPRKGKEGRKGKERKEGKERKGRKGNEWKGEKDESWDRARSSHEGREEGG